MLELELVPIEFKRGRGEGEEMKESEGVVVKRWEGLYEGYPSPGDPEKQQYVVYGRRESYCCLRVYNPGNAKPGVVQKMVCGQSMG